MKFFAIAALAAATLIGCDLLEHHEPERGSIATATSIPEPIKLGLKPAQNIELYLMFSSSACDIAVLKTRNAALGQQTDNFPVWLSESDEFSALVGSLSNFPAAQERLKSVRSEERRCVEQGSEDAARGLDFAESAMRTELELITIPKRAAQRKTIAQLEDDVKQAKEDFRKVADAVNQAVLDAAEDALANAKKTEAGKEKQS